LGGENNYPADLKEARLLLGFPEESVGRLMTPDYVAVRKSWTISQALEHVPVWGRGVKRCFRFTRFGLDPAVASSPLITTIVDAVGLLIYFSTANLVLL
jgi:Mg/Co/Ni transporter MgtE